MANSAAAEEFVDNLLKNEAHDTPSDNVKADQLVMELPEWYNEKEFNQGRRFFNDFSFSFPTSMMMGLVAVFAIPSILKILVGSKRSSSVFTSYRRYLSTLLHTLSWFDHELKPGSYSWKSLYTVRSRHLKASIASKAKDMGVVSQRDIALTQFGFIGYSILKPDKFSIRQLEDGDWEAYNHFWRVIGHMIGLEDRYNICRKTIEETREVCEVLLRRVFTPCLENVPEYFEHMSRVMLDGMWSVNPTVDINAALYWVRYLSDVPGYIYTESDRIIFQKKLAKVLQGKSLDTGVDTALLVEKPALEGIPDRPPRLLYYRDYNKIESVPSYKKLSLRSKYKLFLGNLYMTIYTSYLGRMYFNLNFRFSAFLMKYLPFLSFFRYGIRQSYVNMFAEDPMDNTIPKPNSEYYKDEKPLPWYKQVLEFIW
ncbi:hypothetical protein K1T71_011186 [Dendrolimus kikuchii]|uniref:Uncharacterized protein n=1 Tax=Dendrolimus kikuchii TaxID=765133 RepID=A0ACC1CN53_9NEOP|nr:hypothetical protein K1T71_011186 [Dendrolimus kikuchii]